MIITNSQAEVVRKLIVLLGLGIEPNRTQTAWQVFVSNEPDTPDSVITVTDTEGFLDQRIMINGEWRERLGFQVRVRAASYSAGRAKAKAIANAFDIDVYDEEVAIGSKSYRVHCIDRSSGILHLGKDVPNSKRELFTVNGLVIIDER